MTFKDVVDFLECEELYSFIFQDRYEFLYRYCCEVLASAGDDLFCFSDGEIKFKNKQLPFIITTQNTRNKFL